MKKHPTTILLLFFFVGAMGQKTKPALPNYYDNIKWICVEIDTNKCSPHGEYHAIGIVSFNIDEITRNSYYDTAQWYYKSIRIRWLALKQRNNLEIIVNQSYSPY